MDYIDKYIAGANRLLKQFGKKEYRGFFDTRDGKLLAYQLPTISVGDFAPQNVKDIAAPVFDFEILPLCAGYKQKEKKEIFSLIVYACMKAIHARALVEVSLDHNKVSRIFIAIVEAGETAGYWNLLRAKKGSVRQSLMLPTAKLKALLPSKSALDIWKPPNFFVKNRKWKDNHKEERIELEVDKSNSVVNKTQTMLSKINECNNDSSKVPIYYYISQDVELSHIVLDATEPVYVHSYHHSIFQGDYTLGGRAYSIGAFGHTNIKREYRTSLVFGDEGAVEIDIRAMFTRLLYHLVGIDYQLDPYIAIWGTTATDDQRALGKLVMNTTIHADSEQDAIKSLNFAQSSYNKKRKGEKNARQKEGTDALEAETLRKQLKASGKSFADIVAMAKVAHAPISGFFHKPNIGNKLQRIESNIIIHVLYDIASYDIRGLSLHDAVIVPESKAPLAKQLIMEYYRQAVGFYPLLKISKTITNENYSVFPLPDIESVKSRIF